jgi:hypothetical protein
MTKPLAQPDDPREGIDDAKAALLGSGDKKPTVVRAKIKRRIETPVFGQSLVLAAKGRTLRPAGATAWRQGAMAAAARASRTSARLVLHAGACRRPSRRSDSWGPAAACFVGRKTAPLVGHRCPPGLTGAPLGPVRAMPLAPATLTVAARGGLVLLSVRRPTCRTAARPCARQSVGVRGWFLGHVMSV